MTMFAAPGNLHELSDANAKAWNDQLSDFFDTGRTEAAKAAQDVGADPDRQWFYNPITSPTPPPAATKDITWIAFPKIVRSEAATDRAAWRKADDDRDEQSEYCEWETLRDPVRNNEVVRVTLTSETPDYYRFLAEHDRDHLLDLYRTHVSPQVQPSDLIVGGQYQTRNRWNLPQTAGDRGRIMHMAQGNNELLAAIILAAVASWPRAQGDGDGITNEQPLIACAQFGEAGRHSDPHIGALVNELVRAGNEVSLADPAALYIDAIDTTDWETPDGSRPSDWIRVVRPEIERKAGVEPTDFALRVVVEAPAGSDAVLGDVTIGGNKIAFGGQVADKVSVRLRGIARAAPSQAPILACAGGRGLVAAMTEEVAAGPVLPTRRVRVAANTSPG
jgi:hypothetical protein